VKILEDKYYEGCMYLSKNNFWICRKVKQKGVFAHKLEIFRREKARYSNLVKDAKLCKDKAAEVEYSAKLLATKILLNGGYGCFGSEQFRYFNPLVAEAITTFGRYTLSKMQVIAKSFRFEICYGDTDSLLLVGKNKSTISKETLDAFTKRCADKLQVELEKKATYEKIILSAGKKHYIGVTRNNKGEKELEIKGFEGKKSDRCAFIQQVFKKMINTILLDGNDPLPDIRKAINDLKTKKVKSELLKISIRLNQNPEDYKSQTCRPAKIGKELNLRKGELAEFYESDMKKTGKSYLFDPQDADPRKYVQALWNTVQEVLELVGYPKAELAKEFTVKVATKKKNAKKKSTTSSSGRSSTDNAAGNHQRQSLDTYYYN
jgi:DNA polymerase elongation subunit (family B)